MADANRILIIAEHDGAALNPSVAKCVACAATIDAAHQLHIDDDVGSIAVGKFADLTILDADPLAVEPLAIKDIGVVGTVLAGVPTA